MQTHVPETHSRLLLKVGVNFGVLANPRPDEAQCPGCKSAVPSVSPTAEKPLVRRAATSSRVQTHLPGLAGQRPLFPSTSEVSDSVGSCWRPCAQGSQGGARPEAADVPGPGGARGPVGAGTLHSGCSVRRGSMSRSVGFPASGLQILGFLTSRGPFSSQARQMARYHSASQQLPLGLAHTCRCLAGANQILPTFDPSLCFYKIYLFCINCRRRQVAHC